jgi:hypothetical protein
MPVKAKRDAVEQLELFRPPPQRPLWNALPDHVRSDVRDLVAQMLREHVERSAKGDEAEVNDD